MTITWNKNFNPLVKAHIKNLYLNEVTRQRVIFSGVTNMFLGYSTINVIGNW